MRQFSSAPEAEADQFNAVEGITFSLDGQEFTCGGFASALEVSELARGASEDTDAASAAGIAYMANFMRLALGPAEYQRFRRHCAARRTPSEVQVQILGYLMAEIDRAVERAAGRPTSEPPGSSGGQPDPAGRVSKVISLQRGEVQVVDGQPKRRPGHRAQGAPRSAPRRGGSAAASAG